MYWEHFSLYIIIYLKSWQVIQVSFMFLLVLHFKTISSWVRISLFSHTEYNRLIKKQIYKGWCQTKIITHQVMWSSANQTLQNLQSNTSIPHWVKPVTPKKTVDLSVVIENKPSCKKRLQLAGFLFSYCDLWFLIEILNNIILSNITLVRYDWKNSAKFQRMSQISLWDSTILPDQFPFPCILYHFFRVICF